MAEILLFRIYQDFVGICGMLGNGLVCFIICKIPAMQTRTNVFIFHQAVIDFLGSTMILLHNEIKVPYPIPSHALRWFVCHVWSGLVIIFFFYVLSTFNLLVLTLERYFAIVHPFKYQVLFATWPRLKTGIAIAMCWVVSALLKSYLLFISKEKNGFCVPSVIPGSRALGILTAFMQYIIPVGVMLFAYIRISVEMKRGAARVCPTPAAHLPDGANAPDMAESLLRARRNTFKMLLIVFSTFLVCWTPNQVIFLMFNLGWEITFNEWFYLLSLSLVATNSCVNPVIYAFKYRQFRNGLRLVFGARRNHPTVTGTFSVGSTVETEQ